jgi:transcriptional regulator with XRE-family HTH domain
MEPSGPRLRANRKKQQILLSLLREAREKRGLRQIDVARALGCPQTRVSKYELGTRRLDLLELREVCEVLRVSVVEFVRAFDDAVASLEHPNPNRKRPRLAVAKEPRS